MYTFPPSIGIVGSRFMYSKTLAPADIPKNDLPIVSKTFYRFDQIL